MKFHVVFTHAFKSWTYLNELCDYEMISIFGIHHVKNIDFSYTLYMISIFVIHPVNDIDFVIHPVNDIDFWDTPCI